MIPGPCNATHPPRLVEAEIRHQLVVLSRRSTARVTEFSIRRPTKWQPGQVRNPEGALDGYFTDAAAWELIATKLEEGHDFEVVQLRHPVGKAAFVLKIELAAGEPLLYVKLELGAGKVFGRSFHYSERP